MQRPQLKYDVIQLIYDVISIAMLRETFALCFVFVFIFAIQCDVVDKGDLNDAADDDNNAADNYGRIRWANIPAIKISRALLISRPF